MKMLTNNQIPGLLLVKGRGVNGRSRYEYEIQGKHSLEFLTQKGPVTYEMIIAIIEDLLAVMDEMRDYLLSPNQLLLDPRSIFMEGGRYYFCYYPSNVKGISESFHELAEFFVRETDYQDRSGIYISYALHKMTIQELCAYIGADSLAFISEEGLQKSIHFEKEHTCDLCMACFNRKYVTPLYDNDFQDD